MKKSFLYLAFTIAACISGPALALSTTFDEYDEMTVEEQGKFLVDRTKKIFSWLYDNDRAKAVCMVEKFDTLEETGVSRALIDLKKLMKGVPEKDRASSQVEDLMAYYVLNQLCGDVTSKASDSGSVDRSAK